jgi:hypothetical protein
MMNEEGANRIYHNFLGRNILAIFSQEYLRKKKDSYGY